MDIFHWELLTSFTVVVVANVISRYFWGQLRPADNPKYLFAYHSTLAIVSAVAAALAAAIAFCF